MDNEARDNILLRHCWEQIPNPSVFKVKGTLGVQHESHNDIQLEFQVDSVDHCEAFLIAKI